MNLVGKGRHLGIGDEFCGGYVPFVDSVTVFLLHFVPLAIGE